MEVECTMKKYIISSIIIFILISFFIHTVSANESVDGYIYLKAEKSRIVINEEFSVELYIETDKKVGALQFSVLYDPNVVKIKKVELAENNKHVMMQSNLERGNINCGIITLNGINSGKLLIIRAVGVKKGTAEFKIRLQEVADINVNVLNFKVGEPISILIHSPTVSYTSQSSVHTHKTTTTHISTIITPSHTPSSTTVTPIQTSTPSHTKSSKQTKSSMTSTSSPVPSTKVMSTKTTTIKTSTPLATLTIPTQRRTFSRSETLARAQTSTILPTKTLEETARIFIASSPSGADVYINNRYLGTTPLMIEVSPGQYIIKVAYKNITKEREIAVSSGQEYSLNFVLIKQKNTATSSNTKNICGPGSIIAISILYCIIRKLRRFNF